MATQTRERLRPSSIASIQSGEWLLVAWSLYNGYATVVEFLVLVACEVK